jgi:uncharacterized protein (DUF1501 family)
MKRRKFLQVSGLSLPLALNGWNVKALAKSSLFDTIDENSDKVLVLIQLNGGNDGLNMIVPLDQYDRLANVRSNILIPKTSLLDVGYNNGFHPAMTGLKYVFQNGSMGVIQSVGYPNQNRSHFRSMDIWQSGSPANQIWTTGWLGRYFSKNHPNYPSGYPNATNPHPFALTIGSLVSETCQGTASNYSLAITDPFNLNPLLNTGDTVLPDSPYGNELRFLRETLESTNAYSKAITESAKSGTNAANYPSNNNLAQQLKNIAVLISGGLKTQVYIVSLGGFDTHSAQVSTSPTLGVHANLLQTLSDAVKAFQDDLRLLNLDKRVLTMTFSEFGRRIRSNDSSGTDHGDAAPLMLFGSCVKPGFVGSNPQIPVNPTVQDALPMQYDFRNVYGSVLMDWFGVPESDIKSLFFKDFTKLAIIAGCATTDTFEEKREVEANAFPNPFSSDVSFNFSCKNEHVRLSLFNGFGQELKVFINKELPAGNHLVNYNGAHLTAGTYYFHLRFNGDRQKTFMMVKN